MRELYKQLKIELRERTRPARQIYKKGYRLLEDFLNIILLVRPIWAFCRYVKYTYTRMYIIANVSRLYTLYYMCILLMYTYCLLIYIFLDQYLLQSIKDTTRLVF